MKGSVTREANLKARRMETIRRLKEATEKAREMMETTKKATNNVRAVRMALHEWAAVQMVAEANGMPVTTWLREAALRVAIQELADLLGPDGD